MSFSGGIHGTKEVFRSSAVGVLAAWTLVQKGVQGLHDELKAGRPRSISDEKVALPVRKTLQKIPKCGMHWTIRSIVRETRLSHTTVHRIWQALVSNHTARNISSSPLTHSLLKESTISWVSTSAHLRTL
jgi:hypothetical protein